MPDEEPKLKSEIKKPNVVIIGAGYSGINCAKELDSSKKFNVTLIDKNGYFMNTFAALRTAVRDRWSDNVILDSTKLMKNGGKILQGNILSIDVRNKFVTTNDSSTFQYDYLVIATGQQHQFPARSPSTAGGQAKQIYQQFYGDIQRGKSITIIGGGM